MNFRKNENGFTLIELVVVIIILGILSAFALPRFANLTSQAEQAVFDGYVGAFRSGVKQFQVNWYAQGQPTTAPTGFTSTPSALGYPAGGNNLTTAFESDCNTIWQDVLTDQDIPTFLTANNGWASSVSSADWSRNASRLNQLGETQDIFCHFIYTGAYNNGAFSGESDQRTPTIQYNIQTGEVNTVGWPFNP